MSEPLALVILTVIGPLDTLAHVVAIAGAGFVLLEFALLMGSALATGGSETGGSG